MTTIKILGCTFTKNASGRVAAGLSTGVGGIDGRMLIEDCDFVSNVAAENAGGAAVGETASRRQTAPRT